MTNDLVNLRENIYPSFMRIMVHLQDLDSITDIVNAVGCSYAHGRALVLIAVDKGLLEKIKRGRTILLKHTAKGKKFQSLAKKLMDIYNEN